MQVLPSGSSTGCWAQGHECCCATISRAIETIFGPAAGLVRSDALIRLTVGRSAPPALLAFGTRHPGYFHAGQGTELLSFLARVIEHCLRLWLGLKA